MNESGERQPPIEEEIIPETTSVEQYPSEVEAWMQAVMNGESIPEIPSELKERVMGKMADVLEKGTAFRGLGGSDYKFFADQKRRDEFMRSVIRDGLLGTNAELYFDGSDDPIAHKWARAVKKGNARVYANIIGRTINNIADAPFVSHMNVIFSIDNFQETIPQQRRDLIGKSKTFRHDSAGAGYNVQLMVERLGLEPNTSIKDLVTLLKENQAFVKEKFEVEENNETLIPALLRYIDRIPQDGLVNPTEGVMITHRIAPRYYKGFVLAPEQPISREERQSFDKEIAIFIRQMVIAVHDLPERILPVYDVDGNMLWPEQITHEEIQERLREQKISQSE